MEGFSNCWGFHSSPDSSSYLLRYFRSYLLSLYIVFSTMMWDNNSTYCQGLLWGFHGIKRRKHSTQCLGPTDCHCVLRVITVLSIHTFFERLSWEKPLAEDNSGIKGNYPRIRRRRKGLRKTFHKSLLPRSYSALNAAHGMMANRTKIWFVSKLEKNGHTPWLIPETEP